MGNIFRKFRRDKDYINPPTIKHNNQVPDTIDKLEHDETDIINDFINNYRVVEKINADNKNKKIYIVMSHSIKYIVKTKKSLQEHEEEIHKKLSQIRHPNIQNVLFMYHNIGYTWFVYEYIEGDDLFTKHHPGKP